MECLFNRNTGKAPVSQRLCHQRIFSSRYNIITIIVLINNNYYIIIIIIIIRIGLIIIIMTYDISSNN